MAERLFSMDITMNDARTSNARILVAYQTADGQPATIDGPQHAESSNPAMASVMSQQEVDGQHEVIYELHPVAGSATLSGFGDADRGDGMRQISWEVPLTIRTDEAQSATVTIAELVPKV